MAAVAYAHWLPTWQLGVPFGAGVHLFFVLSGFLITRILLDVRHRRSRLEGVGHFYVRRALRLLPAFYVVLGAAWLADVPLARATWPWHATYLSNVYTAGQQAWQGHFSHFWSLAVEQQFYLVWPWIIVWTPARVLPWVIGASVVAGPVARAMAAGRGLPEPFWALVPAGSADSLGIGALVAWTYWAPRPLSRGPHAWPRVALVGMAGWLALAIGDAAGAAWSASLAVWRQTLQAFVFAWIVARASTHPFGGLGRGLAHPLVVAVGTVSYGVYLVHAFAPLFVDALARASGAAAGPPPGSWVRALWSWAMSLALAWLLWQVVERPAHRLKARFTGPDAPLTRDA